MSYVEVEWFMQDCFINIVDFGEVATAQLTKEEVDAFVRAIVAGTNWEIDDDVAQLHWQRSQHVLMVGTLTAIIPGGGVLGKFADALSSRKDFSTKVDDKDA